MYSYAILALIAGAAAQGGAVPAGVNPPNTFGFDAATVQPSHGGRAVCVSGIVSVDASTSKNTKFNFEIPKNQAQVTNTFLELFTDGSAFTKQIAGSPQTISGTYEIGATLCTPANNTAPSQVQILTHGIGFDRYYWDFAPGYSYVDIAAQYGHATFLYDRLGVGQSTKGDPLNVVQAPLEIEIANTLAKKLRSGALGSVKFSKVIGTGHSFGSVITQAISAQYPDTLDAAILTGFSVNSTGMAAFTLANNFAIASQIQPYRFSSLNNGYLVTSTAIAAQTAFFRAPSFDPNILSLADATKGSVTFGELFSISAVTVPAASFTKPVAVINGDADLVFCLGNCSYPVNKAQAVFPVLYPKANVTGTYLAPFTGHGLNFHYTAVKAFEYIQEFVKKNVH